jgi:hypothetical protein
LDLYALFNREDGEAETNQTTVGARWAGEENAIRFRGEGSFQTGERDGFDVTAFMLGGRLGAKLAGGSGTVTLWYDYLSGDSAPTEGELRVFDTLLATNHPFYGLADYFTNIPRDTGGRGLQDLALKTSYAPVAPLTVAIDVHSFRVARSAGLRTGHLAEELDITATYGVGNHLRAVGGFSLLFAREGLAEIGRFDHDATWMYAMLDASF